MGGGGSGDIIYHLISDRATLLALLPIADSVQIPIFGIMATLFRTIYVDRSGTKAVSWVWTTFDSALALTSSCINFLLV